ncbi:MAG TPA: 2-oxo-4-hydroxy-4-carboxy-5-ureidoimidazoline decarboxylase, partial [bacterium]|nr:2-oxo-4-hydroxy-4-carboxy-5-ureidoimidazoline decarboxylase [bacterium]
MDALAELFEGRTRLVVRLAQRLDPLGDVSAVLAEAPEDELIEALNAHPRIGAGPMSARSAQEQGDDADPAVLDALVRLNRAYEDRFGFRFVVFVNGQRRAAIVRVLEERMGRTRAEELRTGVHDLMAIARTRYRVRRPGG